LYRTWPFVLIPLVENRAVYASSRFIEQGPITWLHL
jgi:hypothetical protein